MVVAGAARWQSGRRCSFDRVVLAVPAVRHRTAGDVLQPGARRGARERGRARYATRHHKAQKCRRLRQ